MGYQSPSSSRRGSGRGRGKIHSEKGKRKGHKHRSGGKYLLSASEAPSFKEVVEKTLGSLSHLGNQTFAFSPFSQYFDDWLISLKSVISEFESNPAIEVDEEFVKTRSQLIAAIELKLSERQREEAVLENTTRKLAKQRSILVQTDTEYTYGNQNLASERKSETKHLNHTIRDLQEELEEIAQTQVSVFSPLARRSKSRKKAELTRKLNAAKSELESVMKDLEAEQEKLRLAYEKKKQALIEEVKRLEKKIGGSEADVSLEDRKIACEELLKAVQAFFQRKRPQ
jgi:vacuolar-type H+-ATPase subunit I/STV1